MRRFVLVAGEHSGDLLGAGLIKAIKQQHPEAVFAGIGGPLMHAEGLECWHQCDELAVMGLVEVLRHLPRLLRIRSALIGRIIKWQPDCFVGIDAPDFNLPVERKLKRRQIATVHYVSPSIWAWRQGRAATMGRCADRVLTLFPFEPELYRQHGVEARFVGHPLADEFPEAPDAEFHRRQLKLPVTGKLLTVMPGSRSSEVERLGPIFARAMALIHQKQPAVLFVAPCANENTRSSFETQVEKHAPGISMVWLDGQAREAMMASDLVLLASGTAALEAMLAKRPMVVAYRIAHLTYWVVKALGLLKVTRYSLPNALAGRQLVPELMQYELTPESLANKSLSMLCGEYQQAELQAEFLRLHQELKRDASSLAATAVLALVSKTHDAQS